MKPTPRYKKGDKIGGRYLVHQALMGGMGEVYLCLDLEENYPFALKTFQQRYLTDTHRLRRAFEQEVATWVALEKHPNIVRCFNMETLDRQLFMILEWVAGEEGKGADLRSWLRHGPLDLQIALQIAIDLCKGLLHVQTKRPGLVHRDLKPENILIAQGGLAKITDFGLAQIVAEAELAVTQEDAPHDSRQSLVGDKGIAGTPAYMAPEQWRGEPLDVRTDIYALGCILYELLTGALPFAVAVPVTTPNWPVVWLRTQQQAHEQAPVPRLPVVLPDALNGVVQQCLAKAPEARYAEVTQLLDDLTNVYQAACGEPPRLRPALSAFTAADYNDRGSTYAALGQFEAALADYTQALTLDPHLTQTYYNRANLYAKLGQAEAALANYTQALTIDPHYVKAYNNRGNAYAKLGQQEAALADFTQALTIAPHDAQVYTNRGIAYQALGQHEAALADLTRTLNLDPAYAQAYYNRGVSYAALGQHEAALADYTEAITLDPNNAKTYYNRGLTYHALGQAEAALGDFTQAIALDPHDAQAYSNRGMTYDALGQQEAALANFTQAITIDPHYVKAYLNRGATYEALSKFEAALTDYAQAITLDPNNAQAYSNRGNAYAALGQFEVALADYTRAITLDSLYAQAYLNRGLIYAKSGQNEVALADYTQALTLDPTLALAYFNRGVTYADLDEHTAALADYTQALTLDPSFAPTYINRGNLYNALGQRDQALADFTQAIHLNPVCATAYLNKGIILALMGHLQEALPYLDKAVQLGEQNGTRVAALVSQQLGVNAESQVAPEEQAGMAFAAADSLAAMQQAITRYPILRQPDFIAAIEQAITQQIPPEHHPAFTQRLTWLRQIANTQPRSTP